MKLTRKFSNIFAALAMALLVTPSARGAAQKKSIETVKTETIQLTITVKTSAGAGMRPVRMPVIPGPALDPRMMSG